MRAEVDHLAALVPVELDFQERFFSHAGRDNLICEHRLRRRRAKLHRSGESQGSDFTNANGMLAKELPAVDALHEVQVDPHGLFNTRFRYIHKERIWQVDRSIFPGGKRRRCALRFCGTHTNAKGAGVMFPARPSFPEERAPREFTSGLPCVADPKQFDHSVGEGEATIGRALTGMLIGRALVQTELNKFVGLRSARSCADEKVVKLNAHGGSLRQSVARSQSTQNEVCLFRLLCA